MKKTLLFALLTIFWILLLFPKPVLWNNIVQFAQSKNVEINSGKIKDKRYEFILKSTNLAYRGLHLAHIDEILVRPWLFYNEVNFKNLRFETKIAPVKHLQIFKAKAFYSTVTPQKIKIEGTSNYGDFSGEVLIFKHKGFIVTKGNKLKTNVLKQYFKKTKEGMRYAFDY